MFSLSCQSDIDIVKLALDSVLSLAHGHNTDDDPYGADDPDAAEVDPDAADGVVYGFVF
jgi:hypothetical protein